MEDTANLSENHIAEHSAMPTESSVTVFRELEIALEVKVYMSTSVTVVLMP